MTHELMKVYLRCNENTELIKHSLDRSRQEEKGAYAKSGNH